MKTGGVLVVVTCVRQPNSSLYFYYEKPQFLSMKQ